MMRVKVLLFGPQAAMAKASSIDVMVADRAATCDTVKAALAEASPLLRESIDASRLAVNHAFVSGDHKITEADEVALIGLVSGG